MATKSKKEAPKSKKVTSKEETNVTRITAKDTSVKSKKTVKSQAVSSSKPATKTKRKNVFTAMGEYFKGAWYELKQVRWPTRKATWGLTLAVMIFTAFFVTLIVLLDLGFQQLFELIVN